MKTYKDVPHLLSYGRELEDIDCLIVHGGTLVNVYNHTGFAPAGKVSLQIVSEFTLSEWNVLSEKTK